MSQFDYLPKQTKETVRMIDEADMQHLLDKKLPSAYLKIHGALADMIMDGIPLNQDQLAAFMHPYKKWGRRTDWEFHLLRKSPDVVQGRIVRMTPEKRATLANICGDTLEMLVEAGEMVMAQDIYNHVSLIGINQQTDGQREYVELYDVVIRAQSRNSRSDRDSAVPQTPLRT